MYEALSNLIDRLENPLLRAAKVIPWSCPVPSFGDLSTATVATLGLNPSNREFVDRLGKELDGAARRLPTLKSLGLGRWSEARPKHVEIIIESCRGYFSQNPYDGWFRDLNDIISGTAASYYRETLSFDGDLSVACHLDLIPYATTYKWTELTNLQRGSLLELAGDTLGLLLRDSPVRLIVLNGRTVVNNLERITNVSFIKREMSGWTLPRLKGSGVKGFAYEGTVREIAGIRLKRQVNVLGFNHNIQSSYGVTSRVKAAIREWIAEAAREVIS